MTVGWFTAWPKIWGLSWIFSGSTVSASAESVSFCGGIFPLRLIWSCLWSCKEAQNWLQQATQSCSSTPWGKAATAGTFASGGFPPQKRPQQKESISLLLPLGAGLHTGMTRKACVLQKRFINGRGHLNCNHARFHVGEAPGARATPLAQETLCQVSGTSQRKEACTCYKH